MKLFFYELLLTFKIISNVKIFWLFQGDLVQMKQLPDGPQELRAKAMDFLVTAHGLRHENLNPLIGILKF